MSRHPDEFEDRGRRRRDEYEDRGRRDDRDDRGRRDDRDDYDDRGRGRDDDYDDYDRGGRRGAKRSGGVTAIGIITIIVGSLALLSGLCGMLAGAGWTDAARVLGIGSIGFYGILNIFNGIVMLGIAGTGISGGIGVLQRRNWGRTLSLITAGLCGLSALLSLVMAIVVITWPAFPYKATMIIGSIFNLMIMGVYIVFVFLVLMNRKNAAEFS